VHPVFRVLFPTALGALAGWGYAAWMASLKTG
jgi:hypothetical protein